MRDAAEDQCATLPIEARGLVITRARRRLLDGIDITIDSGSGTLVILGPNGAGKSLLLKALTALVALDEGQVLWGGGPPRRALLSRVGFVLQRPALLRRSVLANIIYALDVAGIAAGEREDRARFVLAQAGLVDRAHVPARLMSGGEQQRVAIARALAIQPDILILDEPTAHLDPASAAAIEAQIMAARRDGMVVVLVTHDVGQARRLASQIVFMHRGRVLERGVAERFFAGPVTKEAAAHISGDLVL
jgi:tungstate transport system ATP-binding protein